ncbi:hypothetical protein CYY_002632 [Polysphondylium violaceum]|uniref:Uncharacterized protein n=1 Tax=Polysphondylium violaceum TaxID=133409 RepID=A0A8J4PW02_9MYCE|nr:hypothetical protein CYY_002632 [Polysphondylium violaceum]
MSDNNNNNNNNNNSNSYTPPHYHHYNNYQPQQQYNSPYDPSKKKKKTYHGIDYNSNSSSNTGSNNSGGLAQNSKNRQAITNNLLYSDALNIKITVHQPIPTDILTKVINQWLNTVDREKTTSDSKPSDQFEYNLVSLIELSYPYDSKTLLDYVITTFCVYRPEYIGVIVKTLIEQIYSGILVYRFNMPPLFAFKQLFSDKKNSLFSNTDTDQQQQPQQHYHHHHHYNNYQQHQQQQKQNVFELNNQIDELDDSNDIPLQILFEITSYNIIYHINNSNSKQPQQQSYIASHWILDCLVKSKLSIIETYFTQLLLVNTKNLSNHRYFRTLHSFIKSRSSDNNNSIDVSKEIRDHIVSMFNSAAPNSLPLDSKKIQPILHTIVPLLIQYQRKYISQDYLFIILYYFSSTTSSFVQRLFHNLISSVSFPTLHNSNNNNPIIDINQYNCINKQNVIIDIIDILKSKSKISNQLLCNNVVQPILQCINEGIFSNNAIELLKEIINSSNYNEILFGVNYEGFVFTESQLQQGYKSIQLLLNTLESYSSTTQTLFFQLWEEYLNTLFTSQSIVAISTSSSSSISSLFWRVRQMLLYFNRFPLELRDMTKRILYSFISIMLEKNRFDSKVVSIYSQLTHICFYLSSCANDESTDEERDNIDLFIEYIQFITTNFKPTHIIYTSVMKSIHQIISNITLIDSSYMLLGFKSSIDSSNSNSSAIGGNSSNNNPSSNSNTSNPINDLVKNSIFTLDIKTIIQSLYYILQILGSRNNSSNSDDLHQQQLNTQILLSNIISNDVNSKNNILQLLKSNDTNLKPISIKLLIEMETHSSSNVFWNQEKIQILFKHLMDPNLFPLCLEFLGIIKEKCCESVLKSLLRNLILSYDSSNSNGSYNQTTTTPSTYMGIIALIEEILVHSPPLTLIALQFIQSHLFTTTSATTSNNNNNNNNYSFDMSANNSGSSNNINDINNQNLLFLLQKIQSLVNTITQSSPPQQSSYTIITSSSSPTTTTTPDSVLNSIVLLMNEIILFSLKNIDDQNGDIQLLQFQLISSIVSTHSYEWHSNFIQEQLYIVVDGLVSQNTPIQNLCHTILKEFINHNPAHHKPLIDEYVEYRNLGKANAYPSIRTPI